MFAPVSFGGALVPVTPETPSVRGLVRQGRKTGASWRFELDEQGWYELVERTREDRKAVFLGLWCDGRAVHALFSDGLPGTEAVLRPLMATCHLDGPRYRGFSSVTEAAAPFERMIRDLWGVEAMDAADVRPLVDRGAWPVTAPLSDRATPAPVSGDMPEFPPPDPVVAESGMVFARGPATGDAESPVHFRLGIAGGRVRTVETLTGFAHRGIAARMAGVSPGDAVLLAGRIDAGAAVAHQWAFSAAVENAFDCDVSASAGQVRALLCEVEHVATHLTVLARTARAARAELVAARLFRARETLFRVCRTTLGRRLPMDCVVPGGVSFDAPGRERPAGGAMADIEVIERLAALCEEVSLFGATEFQDIASLWEATALLTTGLAEKAVVSPELSARLLLGGPVGRASGQGADLRQVMAAYGAVRIRTAVSMEGDAAARCRIRLEDIAGSLGVIPALMDLIRAAPETEAPDFLRPVTMSEREAEGYAMVEGPHGAVCHVVSLKERRMRHCFLADPAGLLNEVREAALAGCVPDDFDALRCSFGVSAAAVDL